MYLDIKSLRQCVYCHNFCKFSCPSYLVSKDQKIIQNQKNYLLYLFNKKNLSLDKNFGKSVYLCNDCRRCETYCIYDNKDVVKNNRYSKELIYKNNLAPREIYKIISNLANNKSIFGKNNKNSNKNIEKINDNNLNLKKYDVFIYLGDYVRFLEPNIFLSFEKLLQYLGISYIYDQNEISDGLVALDFGVEEVFINLAKENVTKIKHFNFNKMVVLDTHSYYCLKEEYKRYGFGFDFEIIHYIDFIYELINKNRIMIKTINRNIKYKYFDPCRLGRYCKIFDIPRNILKKLFNIDYKELNFFKNKEESECCGGYISLFDEKFAKLISSILINEFYDNLDINKFEGVLLTACPLCLHNLKEASENKKLKVYDIIEYIMQNINNI